MKPSVPSPEHLRELLRERANIQPSEAELQRISQGALERAANFRNQSAFRQFWTASPLRSDALITPRFAFAMAALFIVSMSLAIFARLAVRESRQPASATPPILAAQPNAALRNTTPVAFPATRPPSEDAVRELPERPK